MFIHIKNFLTFAKTQYNTSVKIIRTDNKAKFVNSIYHEILTKLDIILQKSCPYTPQPNGVAEIKQRHVLKITRAIKFQVHIPIKFWGHCVQIVVHVINRLISKVIGDISPFEKVNGRKPCLIDPRALSFFLLCKKSSKKLLSYSQEQEV